MSGKYGSEYGELIIPGEFGSNAITSAADNSGNTSSINSIGGLNESVFDPTYGGLLAQVTGDRESVFDPTYGGTLSTPNNAFGLSNLSKFVADNKGLLGLAGAGAALMSNGSGIQKTGYQGTVPNLMATRNMVAAPPTRAQGYRPGAGGVNYGGDVTYLRAPGIDPWAYLSGISSTAAGANLNDNTGIYGAYLNSLKDTGSTATTATGGYGATGLGNTAAATAAATKAANDAAAKLAADASAKAAADLAAANKANDAAAIAAATKAAADAAAATKAAADKIAADKAAADKIAADKVAADKIAADAAAAAKAATAKATADAAAAKAASDKAAADSAAIAASNATAAQKAAAAKAALDAKNASDMAAYNKAKADHAAAQKAAADKIAADKIAADKAAAAKVIADKNAADMAAYNKAKADHAAAQKAIADKAAADKLAADKTTATNTSFSNAAATVRQANAPVATANDINSWILNNPNASAADIAAAIKAGNVTSTNVQNALNLSTFSPAVKSTITTGQGLDTLNSNINKWVAANPYATAAEIEAAKKASGVSAQDIANALTDKTASAGKEYALTQGMGLDQFYQNILDFQAKSPTEKQAADAMKASGVSQADVDMATKYAVSKLPSMGDSASKYFADQKLLADIPDINKSISTYLDSQKPPPPDINKSISSYLADKKLLSEVPDMNKSISTYLASQQPPPPDINKSISSYLADQKLLADVPDMNKSISTYLASQQPPPPDINKSISSYLASQQTAAPDMNKSIASYLADKKLLDDVPDMNSSISSYLAQKKAEEANLDKQESTNQYKPSGDTDYSYMQYAEGGMAKGRYLQGGTDGMADEIPAQIGQDQPAALSHGEFVVPADVVSHLGNGNSDAGAKKLYQMMDKIRMARTGNKKQGKKINPDSFMPGGLASSKYAKGGAVKHFLTGGATTPAGTVGIESNLSNWVGPYVTNMLGQGQALSNMPYQPYMGQLTAGSSPLQNQSFDLASNLGMPYSINAGAQTATDVAGTLKNLPAYSGTTFGNQFEAPKEGTATNFTNQYNAPTPYSPTTSAFDSAQAATYMNPYLMNSLNPQMNEARRQSEITQQQNAAKMTQAGAYGGSRQAILDAETQRNLGTNLAGIVGQGYNTAYGNAMGQFNADQNRKMQEAQFGAQQGMSSAQLQAQFGLSAQQANEAARQFGAQQGMTGAQLGAQYGLAGLQATEASKQFGANYGLQGLQTGLQAAQAQGTLGGLQNQTALNNLNAQLNAGNIQRSVESEGIAADKAAFEEARANPYKMVQYQQSLLQGLPTSAQSYQGIEPTALVKAAQGATSVNALLKALGLID